MTQYRIATWDGIGAPAAQEILNPKFNSDYVIGNTISVWPFFALTETKLVAGRDK